MHTSPSLLAHVHDTHVAVASEECTPPHPPRTETPEYRKAHDFLINTKGMGCQVCGVTKKTLKTPAKNPFGAKQIESHHFPLERSLIDCCDPVKVHVTFHQVYDQATLIQFVDSPANLIILCDQHHRSIRRGIHHLVTQDFAIQQYLWDGYVVAAETKDVAAAEAVDEAIEVAHGEEATVTTTVVVQKTSTITAPASEPDAPAA